MNAATENKRKGCKGCLVAAAIFALVPVLLFVGYAVWGVYANARAVRLSTAFCAQVKPGDTEARVLALAKGANAPDNSFNTGDGYRFMYYGMIFHASECRVALVAGRVTKKELIEYRD